MKRVLMAVLGWCCVWAGDGQAKERALDMLDPQVSYTASFTLTDANGTYDGTVWHVPGKERRDFSTKGGGQSLLIRKDQDAAYLIKPSGRWMVGISLQAAGAMAGGIDGLMVERKTIGEESVAGVKATRQSIKGQAADGSRFDGDGWFSKEGILVRARGIMTPADGKSHAIDTELSSLRIGKVDAVQFEPPTGLLTMDLRKIPPDRMRQALEGLKPMLNGR